jgi:hypothetical protein
MTVLDEIPAAFSSATSCQLDRHLPRIRRKDKPMGAHLCGQSMLESIVGPGKEAARPRR